MIEVKFASLYLDPNNPRLGSDVPGYDNPDLLLGDPIQKDLEGRIVEMYTELETLKESILRQGWVPVDVIIVWEHPKAAGKYVVLEGNTRVTVLRQIRSEYIGIDKLYQERRQKKGDDNESVRELKEKRDAYLKVIDATDKLHVTPLVARDNAELHKVLPQVLGVRHISHAQQWKPYAANRYFARLYQEEFKKAHNNKKLMLDKDIIGRVGQIVSKGETKTRRNIQAALAFDHFKDKFEDRLPKDEQFDDQDHYFFEQILQSAFVMEQFGVDKDSLRIPDEGAEALFQWAFSKPRANRGEENTNVFYKAECIRLWQQMKSHDDKMGTRFAAYYDVSDPKAAPPMRRIEADFLQSKARATPLDTVQQLLDAFSTLTADALISESEHLRPMLETIKKHTTKYLKMLEAAG